MLLPNANHPLSLEGKQKLLTADVEALAEKMREYGLEKSIPAFRERIALLKKLALKPNITIEEINQELKKLGEEYKHVDPLCFCSYSYNAASSS